MVDALRGRSDRRERRPVDELLSSGCDVAALHRHLRAAEVGGEAPKPNDEPAPRRREGARQG